MVATVLIVDDEPANVKLLALLLRVDGYQTVSCQNGADALVMAQTRKPDIILLDIMMPGMDGFEVARELKSRSDTSCIPLIMVTALNDQASRLRALEAGAEEFLSKPIDRAELSIRVKNLLKLKEYSDFLANHNQLLEEQVAARTAQLTDSYHEAIYIMTSAAEHKDEDTGLHVIRISYYCVELAKYMGMDADFIDSIFYASPMHDIGKIGIPDHILRKPGPFLPAEWEIMKTHTKLGGEILSRGQSPYLRMGCEIALNHHERWDGTGYPDGLQGEKIPFSARLMNIADEYDALRARRPYKPAFDHEKAMQIIMTGDERTSPCHFDPAVLAAFLACSEKFREIYEQHTM
jgi:putative two-component system response regulator